MSEHNWQEVAARTWDILTKHAAEKTQIYYSELGDRLGLYHRLMRFPLDLVQDYCLEERKPPLTILVIGKATSEPGSGFVAVPQAARAEAVREVLGWPWEREPNPYGFARDGTSEAQLIDRILEGPVAASTLIEVVPGRGPRQGLFRKALLRAYRGRCAFSGADLEDALEAAHIVPWSQATEVERIDIQNGILLNVYYHRLFDRNILRLSEQLSISLDPGVKADELSDFDRTAIALVNGRLLKKPKFVHQVPSKHLIRRRYVAEAM